MLDAKVFKEILPNGFTILVLPRHDLPKVSMHLFYNVGSKDEGNGLWHAEQKKWINERGIAHFIEHMIFKGTDKLSESDINEVVAHLSGYCNAFTSYDYTGYLFDMPSQHWHEVLPIMADCMKNCTFKQEYLNSEVKAIIQEIKMYNDDYVSVLIERMIGAIFYDHPYHYPIIGYKQDLCHLKRENLLEFYKKHYGPNNAVLVVVGDVEAAEVFIRSEECFGPLAPLENYTKKVFKHDVDISAQNITIRRDLQQPIVLYCWEIPGLRAQKDYLFDLVSWVLGAGKGARLFNKLVTELGLATELQTFVYDLFDHGLLFIYVQPRSFDDIDTIKKVILQEIELLCTTEISDEELRRAQKKTEMDFINLGEDIQKQGYLLGKNYLISGDENKMMEYARYPQENLKKEIQDFFKTYCIESMMHSGNILPLSEKDKQLWASQQKTSDEADGKMLEDIVREEATDESSNYVGTITAQEPQPFNYPKAQLFTLKNGLTVLYHNKPDLNKIDVIIDLKAKHYYDPIDKQGLGVFVADLLQEGTKKYTTQQLAMEIESYGMELNVFPGQVGLTMLGEDAVKGLNLLAEVLMNPTFEPDAIERIREQLLVELNLFWDTPKDFAGQRIRELVYKNHPYSQNSMGTKEGIASVTREDIIAAHKRYIVPGGARLAIVGNLTAYDMHELLESTLGVWVGEALPDIQFPVLAPIKKEEINYPINRDQVVLCYGGLSVDRFSKDFDKLLLFDQSFTGGVLGSMNSRLFELREQTGLFYTIGGSIVAGASKQPGMVYIKTIVSNDRLEEAELAIEAVINEAADNLTLEELEEAQRALINSLIENFSSNRQIASTFIFLDKYDLPSDYFDIRVQQLSAVTTAEIRDVIKNYLNTEKLIKIRIGRVGK